VVGTAERLPPELLNTGDLLAFFTHVDVEIYSLLQLERDLVPYWMPPSSAPPKQLFRLLRDRVGGEARRRGSFSAEMLRGQLAAEGGVQFGDQLPPPSATPAAPAPQIAPSAGYSSVNITLAAVTHFSEQQASVIGELTVRELEALRESAREGRRGDALAQVAAIRGDRVRWDSLARAIRARVLQL
jgi:hypothetical protein